MGLENAEFISDLVANWPLPTDRRREGDDHLRTIKASLKNTFPGMNAPVTATPQQLNNLPANMGAVVAELKKHLVPRGTIIMWSGTNASVPVGWVLCSGQTVTGYGPVPDLRDKFIRAAGTAAPVNTVGGQNTETTNSVGAHTHTADGHALTINQMPLHGHRILGVDNSSSSNADGWTKAASMGIPGEDVGPFAMRATNNAGQQLIESTGAGQTHTHGIQSSGAHTHTVDTVPVYYALSFIIKVTSYVEPA